MDSSQQRPESNVAQPFLFSQEQESRILRAAGCRVEAAVRRDLAESVRDRLGDVADLPVYGAFVTLRRTGRLRACCGHVDLGTPLYQALDTAADRAATDDPRFDPISPHELSQLDVDVWILWAPQTVTAIGEDRLKCITIGKHGVQIARGHARGLLLPGVAVEHGFDARTLLQQLCIKAGLPTDAWKDEHTKLRVFEGHTIHGRLETAESDSRPPAVAGSFYPANPREIERKVESLFSLASPAAAEPWSGVMVPHAGWVYSGRVAAAALSRVIIPNTAIIVCPRHRAHGAPWALAPHRRWLFPGGELTTDPTLAAQLQSGVTGLTFDAEAHREEHAIEVQLPLLARLAPQVRVVGIAIGDGTLPELLRFGGEMAAVLGQLENRPLLVISSDMNHFADDAGTRSLDRLALDAIETLDPAHIYETVRRNRISMCGLGPCVVVMEALRQLGCLTRCELAGYATSADAGAPSDRVVGYAGMLFG